MNNQQSRTHIAGILFLLPLLAYGFGNYLIESVLADPEQLFLSAVPRAPLMSGALLLLVNSLTVIALAVVLYPILARYHQKTALWYFGTRITEAIILMVGLIALLSLFSLAEASAEKPVSDPGYLELFFRVGWQSHYWAYQLAMIALGVGSVPVCFLFARHRLVPPFLSLVGIVGYFLLALGACLELFGCKLGVLLSLPGGLFELTLGLWLIFKGFKEKKCSVEKPETMVG